MRRRDFLSLCGLAAVYCLVPGRQEVYRTDRYGMPIGDPIDENILE